MLEARKERTWGGCSSGRVKNALQQRDIANLPAGLERKARDCHAVDGAARTGGSTLLRVTKLTRTSGATSELDDEALAHKVGTI
jgi:hypothetical protein